MLKELSIRLKEEFGRGFSEDNLYNMRRFYLAWNRVDEFPRSLLENSSAIWQKPSVKLIGDGMDAVVAELTAVDKP